MHLFTNINVYLDMIVKELEIFVSRLCGQQFRLSGQQLRLLTFLFSFLMFKSSLNTLILVLLFAITESIILTDFAQ